MLDYYHIAKLIKEADALVITTGAGMGVDSGLPDFRGPEGFWREYPVVKKLGIRFEEMANPYWFREKPGLAWAFYGHRLHLYRDTEPHRGFYILKDLAKDKKHGYFAVTSNIDGHFQKAGYNEDRIYEVHGSIHHLQCTKPCSDDIWTAEDVNITINDNFEAVGELPKCPHCGSLARPNVLMFGDFSWVSKRTRNQSYNYSRWLDSVGNDKIVVIEIGAGTAVPTIRHISENLVSSANAKLIRINPRDYNVPQGQISVKSGGLEALEHIFEAYNSL